MRAVNTLLHRWQGYSGWNPFLWIEVPKIFDLQCSFYFCCSALITLDVKPCGVSIKDGSRFNLKMKMYLLFRNSVYLRSALWTGSRSLKYLGKDVQGRPKVCNLKTSKALLITILNLREDGKYHSLYQGEKDAALTLRFIYRTDTHTYMHKSSASVDLKLQELLKHTLFPNYSYRETCIVLMR